MRELGYRHTIIGITGNVLDEDVRDYLIAGADMVLAKPIKMEKLGMVLSHVLTHGSLSSPERKLVEVCGRLESVCKSAVVL